jgi:hypothetical protein
MRHLLAFLLLAGCAPTLIRPYCNASGVKVDGLPLPAQLQRAYGGDPAGCEYFVTSTVLSAEMYQGAVIATDTSQRFAVTLGRVSGPQRLYAGHGGVLLSYSAYDCIGYGQVELVADLPDWRVRFDDVACADGTRVEGEMVGHWDD